VGDAEDLHEIGLRDLHAVDTEAIARGEQPPAEAFKNTVNTVAEADLDDFVDDAAGVRQEHRSRSFDLQ
jgi:hypothetical protein